MTIVFYDADNDNLCICSKNEKMKIININDPNLLSNLPEHDILWVNDASYMSKNQIIKWMKGENLEPTYQQKEEQINRFTGFLTNSHTQNNPSEQFARSAQNVNNRLYVHPKHNGTIFIPSITTKKFPEGLELSGKYHFEPLDELPPNLEDNPLFRNLLKKGKIEIVSHEFVMQNAHKRKNMSPAEMATDSILVKDSKSGTAKDVANWGGIDNYSSNNKGEQDGPIEIVVN